MPTKAELKQLAKHIKLKVRRGDTVMIISGKDKGEVGFVAAVSPKEQKVIVLKVNEDNPDQPLPLNAAIKHRKAKTQGEKSARIKIPVPLHVSNVMVVDP
ncbi:MAG: 50S ribosomal protein L24, partial [Fimbriimonadaceae bacterium]|nr:50S ribosomal protein L24 [Fimbriimonadaceae bacterium]